MNILNRNALSNRSAKWLQRNSLSNDGCRNYVKDLCDCVFDIKEYKIEEYCGDYSLYITYGLYSYIIYTNKSSVCLNVADKKINEEKYYMISNKTFVGDKCWYDCLEWIHQRSV